MHRSLLASLSHLVLAVGCAAAAAAQGAFASDSGLLSPWVGVHDAQVASTLLTPVSTAAHGTRVICAADVANTDGSPSDAWLGAFDAGAAAWSAVSSASTPGGSAFTRVALSADGTVAYAMGNQNYQNLGGANPYATQGLVVARDATTGAQLWRDDWPNTPWGTHVKDLAVSADRRWCVVVGFSHKYSWYEPTEAQPFARLYDATDGALISQLALDLTQPGDTSKLQRLLAVAADPQAPVAYVWGEYQLFSGTWRSVLAAIDLPTGQPKWTKPFGLSSTQVPSIRLLIDPSGTRLYSIFQTGVSVWNPDSGAQLGVWGSAGFLCVAFAQGSSGKLALAGRSFSTQVVHLLDANATLLWSSSGPTGELRAVAFAPDEHAIYTAGLQPDAGFGGPSRAVARAHDASSGAAAWTWLSGPASPHALHVDAELPGVVRVLGPATVAGQPQLELTRLDEASGTLLLAQDHPVDVATYDLVRRIAVPASGAWVAALRASSAKGALGGGPSQPGATVERRSAATGALEWSVTDPTLDGPGSTSSPSLAGLGDLAVSPDGTRVYAASRAKGTISARLTVRDAATGALLSAATLDGTGLVNDIELSPDGSRVYGASYSSSGANAWAASSADCSLQWHAQFPFVPSLLEGPQVHASLDGARVVFVHSHQLAATYPGVRVAVLDAASGAPLASGTYYPESGLNGSTHLDSVLSADGQRVYVSLSAGLFAESTSLRVLAFDAQSAQLLWSVTPLPVVNIADRGADITVSADGSVLYVAARRLSGPTGADSRSRLLAFDAATGQALWEVLSDAAQLEAPACVAPRAGDARVRVSGVRGVGTPPRSEWFVREHAAATGLVLAEGSFDLGGKWDPDATVRDVRLDPTGRRAFFAGALRGSTESADAVVLAVDFPLLAAAPPSISIAQAGTPAGAQQLDIAAGPAFAGAMALVLGSASGTAPGIDLGGFVLPLVADAYTSSTLVLANSAFLPGSFGPLDAHGHRVAALVLPAGVSSALAGLAVHHACVLTSGGAVVAASNATPLELVP